MLLAQRGWYEVDPGKASKGPTGIWPRGQNGVGLKAPSRVESQNNMRGDSFVGGLSSKQTASLLSANACHTLPALICLL